METKLESIMLWGHSLAEYRQMFALSDADLTKSIFDCTAGAASFAAEMHQLGHHVIACDGMYGQTKQALQTKLDQAYQALLAELQRNVDNFRWQNVTSPRALADAWYQTAQVFLQDYDAGLAAGRYIMAKPPQFEFADHTFDLALCSHFLFHKYFHQDSERFLIDAVLGLARIASEVRIFPLLDVKGNISKLIGPVMLALQQREFGIEVKQVDYEFQQGGNAMLRVWARTCTV